MSTAILHGEPTSTLSDEIQPYFRQPLDRLGLDPATRVLAISFSAFSVAFALGVVEGGNTAGFRYRAENAHRLPTSEAGWYLYQKSKSYHTTIGGIRQGVKNGFGFAGWAALFVAVEEGLDRARGRIFADAKEREQGLLARGQRDVLSTVSAAVTVAGIYSWKNRLDRFAATRLTKLGLKIAIPLGLAQDVLATLRGQRPRYVEWMLGRTLERI